MIMVLKKLKSAIRGFESSAREQIRVASGCSLHLQAKSKLVAR
jgi:hypothetical protein